MCLWEVVAHPVRASAPDVCRPERRKVRVRPQPDTFYRHRLPCTASIRSLFLSFTVGDGLKGKSATFNKTEPNEIVFDCPAWRPGWKKIGSECSSQTIGIGSTTIIRSLFWTTVTKTWRISKYFICEQYVLEIQYISDKCRGYFTRKLLWVGMQKCELNNKLVIDAKLMTPTLRGVVQISDDWRARIC